MNCDTKHIRIEEYNYTLPDERIAKYPVETRDQSKLLIYRNGEISHDIFTSLPELLPEGALMVFNNTKVIQARLHFRKESGALIEIFCLEPYNPNDYAVMFSQRKKCSWLCMIGNLKKWKEGSLSRIIHAGGKDVTVYAKKIEQHGTSHLVEFSWNESDITFAELLDAIGELPIPPYLNRETEERDKETYQTVYSKIKGSVAAPTAGLHFTERVLRALDNRGIERDEITLHVGAGTFKPVKSKEIAGHEMHSEYIMVPKESIEKLLKHNGACIAVGTTSVRTLESLYYIGVMLSKNPEATEEELSVQQWMPYEYSAEKEQLSATDSLRFILDYLNKNNLASLHTSTRIIIAPGYTYHIVKTIITNFHQPQSTLLLLVSAFVGEDWKRIYRYAMENEFRFLSYGDSSILNP